MICDRYDNHRYFFYQGHLTFKKKISFPTVLISFDIDIDSKSRINSLATWNSTATDTIIINNADTISMKFDISLGISTNTIKKVALSYTSISFISKKYYWDFQRKSYVRQNFDIHHCTVVAVTVTVVVTFNIDHTISDAVITAVSVAVTVVIHIPVGVSSALL